MTDETIMQALVEIQRTQIILAKKTEATSDLIDDGYAFAIDKGLCPFLHTGESHPFDAGYKIKREFANKVLIYCADKWNAKEPLSFYDLEGQFGRDERVELIFILRYAALNGRFDNAFFAGLAANCPTEAHGLNDPFKASEIGVI